MTENVPSTGLSSDPPTGLRQRQREQTIELIIDAFSELTLVNPRFTMQQLADAAGISVRTLYRYFANRDELVAGMLDVVNQRMGADHVAGIGILEQGSEQRIKKSYQIFGEHDRLMRAVVLARLSGALDDPDHRRRSQRIVEGVDNRLGDRPDVLKRQFAGLVRLLGGSVSWMTLTDGALDLSDAEAGDAAVWALRTLTEAALEEEQDRLA